MTSAVRTLRPGEALFLADLGVDESADLAVALTASGQLPDMVALLVSQTGKVRSDDDLVFYNNTASMDTAVSWTGRARDAEWIRVAPDRLDTDVDRIVLGCAGGQLDVAAAGSLTLTLGDVNGRVLATATFPAEIDFRAMILFEIYRRNGQWRCRLLAQGYAGGLAALVTEFGVEVDDPGDATPVGAYPVPEPPAMPVRAGAIPQSQPEPTPSAATPPPPSSTPSSPVPTAPPAYPSPSPSAPPAASWTTQPTAANVPPRQPTSPPSYSPRSDVPPQPQPPQWAPPSDPGRRGGMFTSRKRAQLEAQNAELNRLLTTSGAMDNAAIAAERTRLLGEVAALAAEADRRRADLAGLDQRLGELRKAIAASEEEIELHDVGIYRYRHRLDDSIAYKGAVTALRDRIRDTAKRGAAVTGNTNWTVDGSIVKGRKMVNEVSKLMLRAYNADADHAVRTMRAYKLDTALTRLDTTRNTIARLGTTMNIRVSDEYHRLRRQELELTADYLSKVEEEKERQRQLREDQREQQRADAEYVREQERLERDRHRYSEALAQLEARGETQNAIEVRSQLTSITAALAGLAQRRANLRLGHVYVISNIGAFGKRMVKIGMTRRLDPLDRVRELGDASVPFRFDVHAIIFSDDAVALEAALHRHFAAQRVNHVNARREFFYVTPAEVRDAIAGLDSQYLLEFREEVDAPEWRQSGGPDRAILPT